jgi:hypothetical protein
MTFKLFQKLLIVFCLLVLSSAEVTAQSKPEDFGVWLSAAYVQTLSDKWEFQITEQIRTQDNSTRLGLAYTNLGLTHKFSRYFRLSAAYRFINRRRDEDIWGIRHRMMLDARLRIFPKRSTLQYRSRLQADVGGNGYFGPTSNIPRIYWRHTVKYSYNLSRKLQPYVSAEARFQLQRVGRPESDGFDRLRLAIGTDIQLTKKHAIGIYGMLNEPFNRAGSTRRWVIGVDYVFEN